MTPLDVVSPDAVSEGLLRRVLAKRLPKAELHLHLHGALSPTALHALSQGQSRPRQTSRLDAEFDYRGAEWFFGAIDGFATLLTTPDRIRAAALGALRSAVDNGARHVELMVTPQSHSDVASLDELLVGLHDAFAQLTEETGVGGGIILEMYRPHGATEGKKLVEAAAEAVQRGIPVLGIGNDGPIQGATIADLGPAYEYAKELGLRTTCHADTLQDVEESLDLPLDRLDHAFDLVDRPNLQARVLELDLPVTMCITSNMIMLPKAFPQASDHPFEQFRRAGIRVSLNTDDPPLFFTDLAQEYHIAASAFGWSGVEMAEVALESLRSSWLSPTETALMDGWAAEGCALLLNPLAPDLM